jgi:DnaJ family protein A protein 5
LFDTLASEEFPYIEDDDEKDFPTFGNSTSDYDQVVAAFYARWTSFSTQRSFAWLDKYNLKDADDRYTLKCMDKENRKLRDEGKKQRNEEIRNLVQYIRRRDPRVKAYSEQLEARKKQEFLRVEQQRKDQILRNLR